MMKRDVRASRQVSFTGYCEISSTLCRLGYQIPKNNLGHSSSDQFTRAMAEFLGQIKGCPHTTAEFRINERSCG